MGENGGEGMGREREEGRGSRGRTYLHIAVSGWLGFAAFVWGGSGSVECFVDVGGLLVSVLRYGLMSVVFRD